MSVISEMFALKTVKENSWKTSGTNPSVHFWEASRLIDDVSVKKYTTKERGQYKEPKRELSPAGPTQDIPRGQDEAFLPP